MLGGPSGRLPTGSAHKFSDVPAPQIQRSVFDRSHTRKQPFDAGYLVPIFVDEVVPGDTFNLKAQVFGRLATPEVPLMDNLYVDTFFFYCPNRILQTNFKRLLGERDPDPDSSIDYLMPIASAPGGSGYAFGSLQDFMGIRPGVAALEVVNLPMRAYNKTWNWWFRDQNLQDSVAVDLDDGPDDPADYVLLRRGKRHDYFTSALPEPQKGTAVTMALGTSAPVLALGNGVTNVADATTGAGLYWTNAADGTLFAPASDRGLGMPSSGITSSFGDDPGSIGSSLKPRNLFADLSAATAATINQLRESIAMQQLLELDMRGGTRVKELIRAHYGVTVPDYRLDEPEYLGGGSSPLSVIPVPQTSVTSTTPQGNLAAVGVFSPSSGHGFVKSFVEHGFVIGLACIRADLNYQQGIPKWASRRSREELLWPTFANLGEQAILAKEIFAQATADDEIVFGYQERYAEYRYKQNEICGIFRSDASTPLDNWHLAQDFSARPTLGATFIVENPPMTRVIAVTTEPHILFEAHFDLKCARPLPVYSVPGLKRL